ncbi:hypothetical protein ACTFQF_00840 [Aliivibrio fischeri]|uniref:Uncharacterized protein n=1 Tax=Aliivibrio fischeri (strain MJ11) TaxID=388396 RepID=B5EW78_ALIFM|nr:hypothetical protein [Aliivibrio fischeri]ACH64623.1 hypothetical protein VFMJ11_B0135 [Aliivibrio fischeri MJ11]MUK37597.1 hypothetical protein [Aliivibrio fischeri]
MASLDATHSKKEGTLSTRPSKFSEWFYSPSKTFVYAYMFIVATSIFVSGILFIILGISSLLYARKLRKREKEDVLNLMRDYLSAIGKLCIRFVIVTTFFAFIMFSLMNSTQIPQSIVNNSIYLIPIPIILLLLTFILNAVRMHRELPPLTRLIDPILCFISWIIRFSKKQISEICAEFKAKN